MSDQVVQALVTIVTACIGYGALHRDLLALKEIVKGQKAAAAEVEARVKHLEEHAA